VEPAHRAEQTAAVLPAATSEAVERFFAAALSADAASRSRPAIPNTTWRGHRKRRTRRQRSKASQNVGTAVWSLGPDIRITQTDAVNVVSPILLG
jgi:hypothetical protein